MTRMIATIANGEATLTGRIIFVIGEDQPDHLSGLLDAYLGQPDVERVVLLTVTPAVAARVAAPYAAHREDGRLATVLTGDDLEGAIRAARRGWGEPDLLVHTSFERRMAPTAMCHAAD